MSSSPFAAVYRAVTETWTVDPADTTMRVNLNRSGGKTNAQYSQWSRGNTPTPSFHTPDRFGLAHFSAETVLLDGKP